MHAIRGRTLAGVVALVGTLIGIGLAVQPCEALAAPAQLPTNRVPRPTTLTDPLIRWHSASSTTNPIKVWSARSKAEAEATVAIIDERRMYEQFREVMDIEPLTDRGARDDQGRPDFGGDDSVDIYIGPAKLFPRLLQIQGPAICVQERGYNVAGGAHTSPAWILIDQALQGDDLKATLAHELFHAFQYAYNNQAANWWAESTAMWAEDFIGPEWDREQAYLPDAFSAADNRLETLTLQNGGTHERAIYLFPFYLTRIKYDPTIIGTIWKQCATKSALDALESSLPEGLDACFKEFARLSSDIGSNEAVFRDHGSPLVLGEWHGWNETDLRTPPGPPTDYDQTIRVTLPPLAAVYISVANLLDTDVSRQVRFRLEPFVGNPKLSVQAILMKGDSFTEEDWTGRSERTFCLDDERERFEIAYLVLASSERFAETPVSFTIEVRSEECQRQPISAEMTVIREKEILVDMHDMTHPQYTNFNSFHSLERTTVRLVFEETPEKIVWPTNEVFYKYKLCSSALLSHQGQVHGIKRGINWYQEWDLRTSWQTVPGVLKTDPTPAHIRGDGLLLVADRETDRVKFVALQGLVLEVRDRGEENGFVKRRISDPAKGDYWITDDYSGPIDRAETISISCAPENGPFQGDGVKQIVWRQVFVEDDTDTSYQDLTYVGTHKYRERITRELTINRPQHEARETPDPYLFLRPFLRGRQEKP